MKKTVIAIGLDAAEPTLVERLVEQGVLKNLAMLRQQGGYGRLKNFSSYRAETPWTTFLTGCSPQTTGYWGPVKLRDGSYTVDAAGAYDFGDFKSFYSLLGKDYKVAVFDMPQAPLSPEVNGLQVLGWGAHSPQTPSHSLPKGLLEELSERHGKHPAFGHDHANIYSKVQTERLRRELRQGILNRTAICQDLLQRDDWNLFLTMFGETHSGGHCFWHLHEPNHPAHYQQRSADQDYLVETYKEIDEAIGEIIASAPEDASIIVFSAHGMQANNLDLTSTFFLAELMYRWNFPGKFGFSVTSSDKAPQAPSPWRSSQRSYRDLWAQKYDPNPITRWVRTVTPTKLHRIYADLLDRLGISPNSDFVSPYQLQNRDGGFNWQPASWYAPSWPKMKAFALPSFSEGYIRINLQGREPNGLVTPQDYDATCDAVIEQVQGLRSVKTGKPIVDYVVRTRTLETLYDPNLPDADLIIMWNESELTDCVESSDFGRMGPLPYQRSGSHTSRGFAFIKDRDVKAGSDLPEGHALDLAPTILNLMNAPIPDYFEGHSLVENSVVSVIG